MSVAAFTSRDEKLVGDAREDRFRVSRTLTCSTKPKTNPNLTICQYFNESLFTCSCKITFSKGDHQNEAINNKLSFISLCVSMVSR